MKIKDYLVTQEVFEIIFNEELSCYETNIKHIDSLDKYYDFVRYQSHNHDEKNWFNRLYKIAQKYNLSYKYKQITKVNEGGIKLLDYGCGVGDFVLKMNEKKWQAVGFEPNKQAKDILKAKNVPYINDLEEIKEKSLDIITLWHVLEHIDKPLDTINQLKNKLKDSGKLIIAVPNYKSFDAQFYKTEWAAYDVPRHIFHFQRQSFDIMAEKSEMKVFKSEPLCLDAFYVSLLSENYKTNKNSLRGLFIGLISNFKSIYTKEYSSVIYFLEKIK